MSNISKKTVMRSIVGLGLAAAMSVTVTNSTHAISFPEIPALTNGCTGVGGFLTHITDLLLFQLFDRGYDCAVNPPENDSLLESRILST